MSSWDSPRCADVAVGLTLSFAPQHQDNNYTSIQTPITFSITIEKTKEIVPSGTVWDTVLAKANHTRVVTCNVRKLDCERTLLVNLPFIQEAVYRFTIGIEEGYKLELLSNATFSVRACLLSPLLSLPSSLSSAAACGVGWGTTQEQARVISCLLPCPVSP